MSPGQYQWCCGGRAANGIYISAQNVDTKQPEIIVIDSRGEWSFIALPGTGEVVDLSLGTDGGCWASVKRSGGSGPSFDFYHITPNYLGYDRAVISYQPNTRIAAALDNAILPVEVWPDSSSSWGRLTMQYPGKSMQLVAPTEAPPLYLSAVEADETGAVCMWYRRSVAQSGTVPSYGDTFRAIRHTDGTITNDKIYEGALTYENYRYFAANMAVMDAASKNGKNKALVIYDKWSVSSGTQWRYFDIYPGGGWHNSPPSGSGWTITGARMDMDGNGVPSVCWTNYQAYAAGPVYYASEANGWQDVYLGTMRNGTSAYMMDIAVTRAGVPMVAWYDQDWSITLAIKQGSSWVYKKSTDHMTERILGNNIRMVAN